MFIVVALLCLLVSVGLIFFVLIQNSKGGGLASNLQGAQYVSQNFGVRRGSDIVEKITWGLISVLVLLTFVGNAVVDNTSTGETRDEKTRIQQAIQNQQMSSEPTLPNVPGGEGQQQGAPAGPAPQQGGQQQPGAAQPAPEGGEGGQMIEVEPKEQPAEDGAGDGN